MQLPYELSSNFISISITYLYTYQIWHSIEWNVSFYLESNKMENKKKKKINVVLNGLFYVQNTIEQHKRINLLVHVLEFSYFICK